jgi:diguanylate cyclase (GGDEF)-like protein/putative nucleotidyltransferase with HDIG domain
MNLVFLENPQEPLSREIIIGLEFSAQNLFVVESPEAFLLQALQHDSDALVLNGNGNEDIILCLLDQINELFPATPVLVVAPRSSALHHKASQRNYHFQLFFPPSVDQAGVLALLSREAKKELPEEETPEFNEAFLHAFREIFTANFSSENWMLSARSLSQRLSTRLPIRAVSILSASENEVAQTVDSFFALPREVLADIAAQTRERFSKVSTHTLRAALQVRYYGAKEKEGSVTDELRCTHFPFFRNSRLAGIITMAWAADAPIPGHRSERLTRNFSLFNSIVSEAVTLRDKAILDPLTSALRHDTSIDMLEEVRRKAAERGYPFVIGIVDLDHFKEINDTHGHSVGDLVLKSFALRLHQSLRAADHLGRMGGDEFIMIIPGMGVRECRRFAPYLLHSVRSEPLDGGSEKFSVRMSAGFAAVDAYTAQRLTSKQILEITDAAQYRAKQSGKDQAFVYAESEFNPLIEEDASGNSRILPPSAKLRAHPEVENLIRLFRSMLQLKGDLFGYHCFRTERAALRLGEALGFRGKDLWTVMTGGLLHDVGKLGLPEHLLDKPESLTEADRDIVKTHPDIGYRMLEPYSAMRAVAEIVRSHHEYFDGSGYPRGLKGTEIFYPARIVSVAEVFDALVTDRPYRQGLSFEAAFNLIKEESRQHFDPQVVAALERILPQLKDDYSELKDQEINTFNSLELL